MRIIYDFSISLYYLVIRLASPFNAKAAKWIHGRRNLWVALEEKIKKTSGRLIWFHASSLGEFEQGRPVIEAWKRRFPDDTILLSFFSPSGYEVRKNYEAADIVTYLPFDFRKNAARFVEITKPSIAIFIKYDFWFNTLIQLIKSNVPVYYISAAFRPSQHFFKWYGVWQRSILKGINWFFVQNEDSVKLLNMIGIQQVSKSGDTRFDRVFEASSSRKAFSDVAHFVSNAPVLLVGSTWPADEKAMLDVINNDETDRKYIIAPHEIHDSRIEDFIRQSKKLAVRYSQLGVGKKNANILIIDSIGILLHLYQYATVAYIGGGFDKSIHNILEAATFGKPVIFGPNHHKFREASDLINLGGAYCINDAKELGDIINMLFADNEKCMNSSQVCSAYVKERTGATTIIMKKLEEDFKK